ncbi:urea transporter [Amphritea atlantica]|uniref:Urea transporter n=1 Tax=Amphritea atlantica TaxID=355243 RepID=A0ABY5GQB7_9GAMM|nr:urea transporter [Amphritea atlantica]
MACNDFLLWSGLFLRGGFTSFSQIMLQSNPLTGAVFILAIVIYSPLMAAATILGCCVSQTCGLMLCHIGNQRHFKPEGHQQALESGVYGFNGALAGLAVSSLWPWSWLVLILLVIAAVLTSIILWLCWNRFHNTLYTTPFILSIWGCWLLFSPQPNVYSAATTAVPLASAEMGDVVSGLLSSSLAGIGQVMFLNSSVSGGLLLAGLFIASRRAVLCSGVAVLLSMLIAMMSGLPEARVESGIYSYNAVLVVLALSSRGDHSLVKFIAGVFLTVLLTRLLQLSGVIPLTAPFVMSIWLITLLSANPITQRLLKGILSDKALL